MSPTIINAPTNRFCTPDIVKVHQTTGNIYVVDEYPEAFRQRLLVFSPAAPKGLYNGMPAARVITVKQQ